MGWKQTAPADMLARLVRTEDIGQLPLPLVTIAGWFPEAMDDLLHEHCTELGWVDRRGQLDAEVVATLSVLCNATVEFFGWVTKADVTTGVVAAATGRRAVLAIREADSLLLKEIQPGELAGAVVGETPVIPPGTLQAVTVMRSDWYTPTAQRAQHLADLPRSGGGEFHVAVRDHSGRRRQVQPVSYVDTSAGRYLVEITEVGADTQIAFTPAARRGLVSRLTAALSDLLH